MIRLAKMNDKGFSVVASRQRQLVNIRRAQRNASGESFPEWLFSMRDRDDNIGDLAKDAYNDSSFPRHDPTAEELSSYVESKNYPHGASIAADEAVAEYASYIVLNPKDPFVYFVQAGEGGAIKIGSCSGSVRKRIAALQTANPEKLQLLIAVSGTRKNEQKLHRIFAEHRLQGEWFAPHPCLLDFIKGLQLP